MLARCMPRVSVLAVLMAATAGITLAQDNWLGGTGNWSNCADWSLGCPVPANDVLIYSGGNDVVTLDLSATINSLALGGGYGVGSSELKDIGVKQELTINQRLTVGGGGYLDLTGGSTVSAGADSSSAGRIFLFNGSTLAITGNLTITQPSGQTQNVVDLENASALTVMGDVNNAGTLITNNFGNGGNNTLNITGTLTNGNAFELSGPGDTTTLGGFINLLNTVVVNGSTLQINGNASNSYGLYIGAFGPGNATLNITGTLTNTKCCLSSGGVNIQNESQATVGGAVTNSGDFYVGTGSIATFGGGLTNSGTVDVYSGSTLQINGNASNSGAMGTNFLCCGGTGNNTLNITGMLTNGATGTFELFGPSDKSTLGGLNNSGLVQVENGGTLLVGTGIAGATGYYQLANGTLGEFIDMNGFGVIVVNGAAHLDGTLDVQLGQGFNPKVGSTYEFITFTPGSYDGSLFASILNDVFNNGTEMWVLVYNNAGGYVELEAQPTPEPASLLLLGSGLLGLGWSVRRRSRC